MPELSSTERKQLRGMAMNMKPAVNIGHAGLTENVLKEIDSALARNELIKLRFAEGRDTMRQQCEEITEKLRCTLCGNVGHTASFYRKKPKEK